MVRAYGQPVGSIKGPLPFFYFKSVAPKMSQLWILSLVCCLFGAANAAEICFDDLGCFDDLPPWGGTDHRPISRLPWKPDMIGTRFLLFTQQNRYYQEIQPDENVLRLSNYGKLRKTRFIIPGYLEQKDEDWPQSMCKTMLRWENVNCIAVEWKKGVKTQYVQAANNARVVAAQVANMTRLLMSFYKQTPQKFHIIGHSLGAHAAGEVGTLVGNISRITGLDPVEPYFQGSDATVRLDTSDASFVDVIHTDALPFTKNNLGLGMSDVIGHIDFYPNGGELMPGCSKNRGDPSKLDAIWEGAVAFDACNHVRAYQYYSESMVKPHGFLAYPCSDKDSFAAGKCFPCEGKSCPLMGQSSYKFNVSSVSLGSRFFLNTGSDKPYGRYTYRATVTLDGPRPNPGRIFIAMKGGRVVTDEYRVHMGLLIPGKTYEDIINTDVDMGEVSEMAFRWNNYVVNPLGPKYGASRIQLVRGKDAKIYNFCGIQNVAENEVQSLLPCQA